MDHLSSRLLGFAKRQRLAARTVTRLFGKLALGSGERRFALGDQAFGNRPRSQILVAPERTAGMTEQNFKPSPFRR